MSVGGVAGVVDNDSGGDLVTWIESVDPLVGDTAAGGCCSSLSACSILAMS